MNVHVKVTLMSNLLKRVSSFEKLREYKMFTCKNSPVYLTPLDQLSGKVPFQKILVFNCRF